MSVYCQNYCELIMSFERIIVQTDFLRSKEVQTSLSLSRTPVLAAPMVPNAAWGWGFSSVPPNPGKSGVLCRSERLQVPSPPPPHHSLVAQHEHIPIVSLDLMISHPSPSPGTTHMMGRGRTKPSQVPLAQWDEVGPGHPDTTRTACWLLSSWSQRSPG